jgi:hypothetical protein
MRRGAAAAAARIAGAVAFAVGAASPGPAQDPGEAKKPIPLYTNDDLKRVSPYRDQTGALSTPAVASSPEPADPPNAGRPAARSEAYWRREAQRLRDRVRRLDDQMDGLRTRIDDRRRRPGVRPFSDPQIEAWQRRLRVLEERKREEESLFEERARRAGALPGWLR